MATYCALTVRKLKPGTYDEWRQAWWPESDTDMPEGGHVYIIRNMTDPDEIIAFGIFEGTREQLEGMIDPETEKQRQEAMAPFVASTGADGVYEVIEQITTGTTAPVGGAAPA